jgi:hypothetical protein
MKGYPLARIINENYRYLSKKKPETKLGTVIRDTMSEVEDYVRFRFAKYSSCYTDILKYFIEKEHKYLLESIPEINIWIEYGVSQRTQISLIELGLSRPTAISLSEQIGNKNLSKKECRDWLLSDSNTEFLELPQIMLDEIELLVDDLKADQQ